MSGLEAIAALGLACNILQLIGTVGSTITVARNILETGKIDPDLEKHTNELTSLFQDAEGSLSQTSQHKGDKELRAAAGQVLKATREFGSELVKISGGASKGKIRQVIGGTVKGLWRRKKLDELEAEISRCRGMFESRLLLSLRHRIDLGALQQKESFGQLDNSLKSFIKGLSDGHTKLEELMKYQSTTLIDHVTEESRQTRQEISAAIEPVVQKMNHEEKQRFLGSLRYDTMNERRNRVEAAHPGTYKWIFYDSEAPNVDDGDDGDEDGDCDTRYVPKDGIPDFIKSASEKIYWISGKPGSGKSTLMKFMLENSRMADLLNKTSPTGASKIASHFIWAAGAPIQRSLRGTLSSLLFQLVTQDEGALDNLLSKCPNNPQRLSLGDWSDQQLAEALKIVCSSSRSVICLFIDGLDEIDSDDTDKVLAIIDDLCTLTHVKCIVSSRPEQIFSRHFRKLETPSLRMQDLTARDIRLYVRGKLRSWSHSPDRYHDVVKTLCEKADGVFLWVALALKSQRLSAEYEDDPEIVARRFKQLPNGLSELYSDMWDRLNDDKFIYGEEGAKYLNTYLTATHGVLDMDVSTMAFATHPALIMGSSKPPTPPILEHMERTLEKTAVWLEVRTAGLIEVNPKSETVELVHKSALEFLRNDAKGLEIMKLDTRHRKEVILSLLEAKLAIVKYRCDSDRLNQPSRLQRTLSFDLCDRTNGLTTVLGDIKASYEDGEITEVDYLEVLDQAAATYHAIKLLGNKYPFRQCKEFLSSLSGDYFGLMARFGFFEYVSTKIEKHSTKKKPSMRYLEYLWAETCNASYSPEIRSFFRSRAVKWSPNLLPRQNSLSLASLIGGYQRTATGLICIKPLNSIFHFHEVEEVALGRRYCHNILQDASPEHCILFQVSWNRRPNHLFEHNLEFNVFIELPLKMLWEAYNWIKDELSTSFLDVVGSREDLMSAMPELKPRLIFIQCWDPPSKSLEFLDLYPEKYFSLKTEEDKRFVTTAVMQELVMAQEVQTWQEESSALPAFCNSRIADNCFETISTSQFEDILIERGHAFRPSQENPWPPAMFEGIAGPGVGENSGTEDYPSTPATKNGYNAQVYTWNMGGEEFKGVIEGDGLRVVR